MLCCLRIYKRICHIQTLQLLDFHPIPYIWWTESIVRKEACPNFLHLSNSHSWSNHAIYSNPLIWVCIALMVQPVDTKAYHAFTCWCHVLKNKPKPLIAIILNILNGRYKISWHHLKRDQLLVAWSQCITPLEHH